MPKRPAIFIIPFLLLILLSGQSLTLHDSEKEAFAPDKRYAVDQLKEDFALLRTALEEAHAGLYFYTPKEEMDGHFNRLFNGLDHAMTELEFCGYLAPLIANTNDGHTGMMFSRDYDTYLRNQPLLIPFRLLFIEGKAYLLRNYSEVEDVELGGEVVSINGHPMSEILEKMLQKRTRKNERGTYDILVHANLGEQKPLKPTFQGNVYVLINGRSFSGSGETTSLMHYHKKAVFVGEECGAGYYGNTSGLMPTLTLPRTKLRVRIPMVRYHMAVSGYDYPDRGIIPDYPFTRSIEDYLKGKDTEMEYVFGLITERKY